MNKKLLMMAMATGMLFPVGTAVQAAPGGEGIANPAATYCSRIGGRNITRSGPNGETAYCRLRNGRTVDAWKLFRSSEQRRDPRDRAIGADTGNPAGKYCLSRGGRLEPYKGQDGETAFCHLPDGSVTEEWTLFRQQNNQGAEPTAVTRYCTDQGGRLTRNDDGTHGCHTRQGDVFGAQQYYDMHHGKRN